MPRETPPTATGHETATRLDVVRLGRVGYAAALALQEDLVARRARGEIDDRLLLLEHDPVFTLGRGTDPASLPREPGADVVSVSRGGDVTWHGPGQLVGYWIRQLVGPERDLHRHLRLIESGLISALAELGLEGARVPGLTGVWVGDRKVASIGIAVRSWVTYHGFALNVDVDPRVYATFRPCGLDGATMVDLTGLLGRAPEREGVADSVGRAFLELAAERAEEGRNG